MAERVAQTKRGKVFSFVLAGGSGFVIDIGILFMLITFTPMSPFLARVISIACAMFSNFLINRTFTFGASNKGFFQEMVRYASVGAIGALLNYAIFSVLLIAIPGFSPLIATAIAVVLVAFFSWFGYSRFVFGSR